MVMYVLVGSIANKKYQRTFSVTPSNSYAFNDNPDPMKSTGVMKLKNDIKKEYVKKYGSQGGKMFSFSLSTVREGGAPSGRDSDKARKGAIKKRCVGKKCAGKKC
jgi:hypothetical protein